MDIYRTIDVFPADLNSSGIGWYARFNGEILKSDTKEGMKQLINEFIGR